MNGRARLAIISVATVLALTATAAAAAENQADDARLRRLDESFRCVVCQNQSLADSNAELAADLRAQIRAQVREGSTDEQIRAYMVQRYGDFVLYRPPMKPATWALWFGPFGVLVAGSIALWRSISRRRSLEAQALDVDEPVHAAALPGPEQEGAVR